MLAEETVCIAGCQQLDELVAADKVCMSGIDAQSQKICGITSKQIIKLLDLVFCRSFKQVLQTDLYPKLLTIGLQLIQRLACLLIEKSSLVSGFSSKLFVGRYICSTISLPPST